MSKYQKLFELRQVIAPAAREVMQREFMNRGSLSVPNKLADDIAFEAAGAICSAHLFSKNTILATVDPKEDSFHQAISGVDDALQEWSKGGVTFNETRLAILKALGIEVVDGSEVFSDHDDNDEDEAGDAPPSAPPQTLQRRV